MKTESGVRDGQGGNDEGNFDCVMEVQEGVAGNFNRQF